MAFVSLTSDSRAQAESFVERYSIPWPCGYGAALVTPTLYLISPDGRVLWDDGREKSAPVYVPAGDVGGVELYSGSGS